MSYQKFALRLALISTLFFNASPRVLTQDQQVPSNKPRNVKPELKKAYKDWLDKDVTYIITDEERKAFKKLATDDERERFIEEFWRRRDPDPLELGVVLHQPGEVEAVAAQLEELADGQPRAVAEGLAVHHERVDLDPFDRHQAPL